MTVDPKTIILSADLPAIPAVLQQIMSTADNPRTTSSKLEKMVSQEPALSTQLLRWVNSPLYYLPRRVSSIGHAMILLGFSTVKSVVSGMVLINTFDNLPGLKKEYVMELWGHTLRTANIVRILAQNEASEKKDDLFLAGMVHDVGHLVLAQYFKEPYTNLSEPPDFVSPEKELAAFEIDHATIGAAMLAEWKFSETVIELVKFHHNFESQEEVKNKKDFYYLQLAEFLSMKDINTYFDTPEESVEPVIIELLEKIRWSWKKLQEYKDEILKALDNLERLLHQTK